MVITSEKKDKILKLRSQGLSYDKISLECSCSKSTIRKVLNDTDTSTDDTDTSTRTSTKKPRSSQESILKEYPVITYSEIQTLLALWSKLDSKGLVKKSESDYLRDFILKINNF